MGPESPVNVSRVILMRWARMWLRLTSRAAWHVHGMLLWLLQRPQLRFLPVPYPSVITIDQWLLQSEQMGSNPHLQHRSWPRRWTQKARESGSFTMANMIELNGFRSRQGLKQTFLEDPLLMGMMAARQVKGAAAAMRKAALQEAQAQAKKTEERGQKTEAIRQLIGPKGGLPTLKADLLRLAALLHITVSEKATVEDLKALCRPLVNELKADPPKRSSGSSSSGMVAEPKAVEPKPKVKAPPAGMRRPGMDITERQVFENTQDMQAILASQEERFQAMLSQVTQHVMHMASHQFRVAPGEMHQQFEADADVPMDARRLTPEEEHDIRLSAAEDLYVENYMRQHGVHPDEDTQWNEIDG